MSRNLRSYFLLGLFLILAIAGCGNQANKITSPSSPESHAITIGEITLPETGTFRDVTRGDPTGDDAAVYGRYHVNKVTKTIYYEAPTGSLIRILGISCDMSGPPAPGTGWLCGNSEGGYDVFYTDYF